MTIKLNHTIVYVADKQASAEFLAGLFGLLEPVLDQPHWSERSHGRLVAELEQHGP